MLCSYKNTIPAALLLIIALLAGCSQSNVESRLERADKLLAKHHVNQARKLIESEIADHPSDDATYLTAITLYDKAKLYDDAARLGERLLARKRSERGFTPLEEAMLQSDLGSIYFTSGNISAAEHAYKAALKELPNDVNILNNLGYLYADQGINLREALKFTTRAVSLTPDNGTVLDSLGWAQYKLKNYDAALKNLKHAVELEPNESDLRYHLGAVYAANHRNIEAEVEFNKALTLNPQNIDAAKVLKTLHKSSPQR